MGFLKMLWGTGKAPSTVSREEFEQVKHEFDRKMKELDNLIHALKGDEPDYRDGRHTHAP